MSLIKSIIFGGAEFSEDEAFLRFKFRLLYVLLLMGIIFAGLFIIADALGLNRLPAAHILDTKLYLLGTVALTVALHGHKERFAAITWLYAFASLGIHLSALMLVPQDSLRPVWYFVVMPAVYILLDGVAGTVVTVGALVSIFVASAYLSVPFSVNALTTFSLTLVFSSVFFYFYTRRTNSFFVAMVEANRQLRELASTDPLTGLMNARAYYTLCNQLIRSEQRTGAPFAVLFIDIDHFKRINDTYGHEAGDEVLREVAGCIRKAIRQSDVPGRVGGEEFCVFLPGSDQAGASRLAEKLRTGIEELKLVVAGEQAIRVTASIGLASNQEHHLAIEHIQRDADMAMYQAKQQGRNRVTVFEPAA